MKKNRVEKSITIRVDVSMYEAIEEVKWEERKTQSQLLRELIELGLEVKKNGGKN